MMRRADRGSLSLEYVIYAPLFFLVLALIWSFGRAVELEGRLDSASRDAARAVGLSPNLGPPVLTKLAKAIVSDSLQGIGAGAGGCDANSVQVAVNGIAPNTMQVRPGHAVDVGDTVTVTVTCPFHVYDTGLPIPTTYYVHSEFASIVDPNRSVLGGPNAPGLPGTTAPGAPGPTTPAPSDTPSTPEPVISPTGLVPTTTAPAPKPSKSRPGTRPSKSSRAATP